MIVGQAVPEPSLLARLLETIDLPTIGAGFAIAAIAYVSSRFVTRALERIGEGNARRRMFVKKVASVCRIAIFLAAMYGIVMVFLQGRQAMMLGLIGTLLVATGLALKQTISSVVSGILLLVDQPFQVGDRIRFDDVYGDVVDIGLRSVRIRTLGKNVVTIPNNEFLTGEVGSTSAGTLDAMVRWDFYVAITEDHQLVEELVFESCVSSRYAYLEQPVQIVLSEEQTEPGPSTVVTCKAHVIDVRYEGAFETDVTERVRRAFRAHGIRRPYQRTYEIPPRELEDQGA